MKTLITRTLIVITLLFISINTVFSQVPQTERDALIALYNATDGPNWTNNTNWNTAETVDTWHGVVVVEGHVTELQLQSNQLVGPLPSDLENLINLRILNLYSNQLSGSVPLELSNLSDLISLSLYANLLTGTIPSGLGNLSNLITLNLSSNQLTGTIPSELGNLSTLKNLWLQSNQLSGSIPPELGNLSELLFLYLMLNQLTGSIPPELGNLTNVVQMDLWVNQLTGTIPPELGNLSGIQRLRLDRNQLTGSIPSELGDLANLQELYLYDNQLSGSLPPELGNLTNLKLMWINKNQFTGVIPPEFGNMASMESFRLSENQLGGSIPANLGNLSNLTRLHLDINQFNGAIPPELGNLTNLNYLFLEDNLLSGSIPIELYNLSNLQFFWVQNNQLSGSIAPEIGNLSNLKNLHLDQNQFTGGIPEELATVLSLEQLYLSENNFSELPDLTALTNLVPFQIVNNFFTFEDIEPNIGFPSMIYLPQKPIVAPDEILIQEGDELNISIPVGGSANEYQWFKDNIIIPGAITDNLIIPNVTGADAGTYYLRITNNLVAGLTLQTENIDVIMGTLVLGVIEQDYNALVALYNTTDGANWTDNTNWLSAELVETWHGVTVVDNRVTEILLANNQLAGSIPSEIGNLSGLRRLWLNLNQLSGALPSELGDLTKLEEMFLLMNQFSGSIPSELGNLSNLLILNFHNNSLSGTIPQELGNLSNLKELRLGNNQLTGTIPSEIFNLTNLEWLHLAINQLTGTIPAAIGNLSNLDQLWLYDNQFTGSIPVVLANLTLLKEIWLFNNQLSGAIPTEFSNLLNLEDLWLEQNQFTDLPDLSLITSLTDMKIQENGFTFEDIEPNLGVTNFTYTPQDTVLAPEEISLFVGQAWEISVPVGGTANEYQWFKDDVAIEGETNDNLVFESASAEDIGFYSLRITNTLATDLTLWTNDIHIILNNLILGVQAEEYVAILEVYDATDGDNWEDNTNWGSDELVEDWYGVIVEEEHIIGLLLESNLLSGDLPLEIGVLDSLKTLDLSNNQLEGPLPFELGDLSILQNLILDSNLISESIPESFGNLSMLETLLLNSNQLDGIPDLFGIAAIPFLDGLDNLTDFQIQNNKLEFDDLEPNVEITGIVYAPQAIIPGPEPITLIEGEELNVTIPVGGLANEYQWVKDNEDIDGANTDNLVIDNVSATDIGTYYLRITNPVVPELTLYSDDIIVDIITGIRDESINSAFRIYPIPVKNQFNIEFGDMPAGEYDLRIIDLTGKTMYNEQLIMNNSKEVQKLDVNVLPAGIYMLIMQNEDRVFVQKVVKE